MKNFAVIGNPISHSKSPDIFGLLCSKYSLEAKYTRIRLENAEEIFEFINKYNLSGLNVTSPFKEDVFHLLQNTDPVSKKVGAVNLVLCKSGSYYGFNTDVYGVQHSLISNNVDVKGKRCIVLGAGGAARSAVLALMDLGGEVYICNRTDEKAEKIALEYGCGSINYGKLENQLEDSYLLVSAVSDISLVIREKTANMIVLEANYQNPTFKGFCRRYIDGYEWLIYQALKSFEMYFDTKADTKNLRSGILREGTKKNTALIGPTGIGKTTYAKILAGHYEREFFDSDTEIEYKTGMKINDIFKNSGEKYFREIEEEVISDILRKDNIILSVGAGALSSKKNRDLISDKCFTVLLDTDTDKIIQRMDHSEILRRPLIKDQDIREVTEKMFKQRKDNYFAVADLIVKIGSGPINEEAEKIIRELDVR